MNQPDHVLAAHRHADQAAAGTGGEDARVQASLAQAEALLAVAAAIDRLAGALSGRETPGPSAEPGQAYQVTEIRRQYPNAYTPWTAEADAALLAAHQAGHDIDALAGTFGRQPSAIRSRLNHLSASVPTTPPGDAGTMPDTGPQS